MIKSVRRPILVIAILTTVVGSLGCAGYHVGNQFLYRSDIRTVHVPVFESDSFRQFLGLQLTEAVIKQIELNTPLTIADAAVADSFIQGRLIQESNLVASEDSFDEPRVIQATWQVEVTWVDRAGVPLMERQLLRINYGTSFIPEGGQSLSTAYGDIVPRIAREIVGQMETPW